VLGILYAYRHPEKVAAYVGVAQIADFAEGERASYEWALEQARERGDRRAIEELEAMAPGPTTVDEELAKGRWTQKFGGQFHADMSTGTLIQAALGASETNLIDLARFGRGNRFSLERLRPEYSTVDLTRYRAFTVPIYFFLGRYDWHTPAVLAERYFETIDAPEKALVWFDASAHNPPFEEPRRFVRELLEVLGPVTSGG
jgi:pimeloyl-ACP methyl ester carboxylesterase